MSHAVTETLTTTIRELVDANHILFDQGVVDGFGHVSARHPERPDRFLLARSMAPALVTEKDVLEFDLDGNPVQFREGRLRISSNSFTARSTENGRMSCPSCTAIRPPSSHSAS